MRSFWFSAIGLTVFVVAVCICLTSCAHISEDGRTFYGWGSAKTDPATGKVTEITSDPPLKILPLGR